MNSKQTDNTAGAKGKGTGSGKDQLSAKFSVRVENTDHEVVVMVSHDKLQAASKDDAAPSQVGPKAPDGHDYASVWGGEKLDVVAWKPLDSEKDKLWEIHAKQI